MKKELIAEARERFVQWLGGRFHEEKEHCNKLQGKRFVSFRQILPVRDQPGTA